jgi:hypothetical protein
MACPRLLLLVRTCDPRQPGPSFDSDPGSQKKLRFMRVLVASSLLPAAEQSVPGLPPREPDSRPNRGTGDFPSPIPGRIGNRRIPRGKRGISRFLSDAHQLQWARGYRVCSLLSLRKYYAWRKGLFRGFRPAQLGDAKLNLEGPCSLLA